MKAYFLVILTLVVSTFISAQIKLQSTLPDEVLKVISHWNKMNLSCAYLESSLTQQKLFFVAEIKKNKERLFFLFEEGKETPIPLSHYQKTDSSLSFTQTLESQGKEYELQLNYYFDDNSCSYNLIDLESLPPLLETTSNLVFRLIWGYSQGFSINTNYYSFSKKPTNKVLIFDGLSLGYSIKFRLVKDYYLEAKPEIILFSYFPGIGGELGIRKKLNDDFSVAAAVNFHYTMGWRGGTDHTGWATRPGWFVFPGIAFYYRYYQESLFFVGLYLSDISNYYHYHGFGSAFQNQKDLKWHLTAGIEF